MPRFSSPPDCKSHSPLATCSKLWRQFCSALPHRPIADHHVIGWTQHLRSGSQRRAECRRLAVTNTPTAREHRRRSLLQLARSIVSRRAAPDKSAIHLCQWHRVGFCDDVMAENPLTLSSVTPPPLPPAVPVRPEPVAVLRTRGLARAFGRVRAV